MLTQLNILLVEDNADDINLIKRALDTPINQVEVIQNGQLALKYLAEVSDSVDKKPDIIILDWNLPEKNGREILSQIKSSPQLKRVPTVVFTGSDIDTTVLEAYNLHSNCFIQKPTDADEFVNAVQAMVNFWLNVVQLPSKSDYR